MTPNNGRIRQLSMFPFEDFNEGLSPERLGDFKAFVLETLKSPNLIYEQKRDTLAAAAMRSLSYPPVSPEAVDLIDHEVIELIAEGPAPYHPRYVAPDFGKLLRTGSEFMELPPANDLHDATAHLLTAYRYVPIDSPVFIGRIDELLEPYIETVPAETAYRVLRAFWLLADRLNPSAFVHANIGPEETRTGRMLLAFERELKTITNLTLRYDPETTPDSFALDAVENQLQLTKPYFLNHPQMRADWGDDYVIASCYNTMRLGGGIYTLVRLNLKELVMRSGGSLAGVLERAIPHAVAHAVEVINSRVRFQVEEAGWFDHNFWVREGLLHRDRFTAYCGVFGLAEAVNWIVAHGGRPEARYGQDPEANEIAARISEQIAQELEKHEGAYCDGWHGRVLYHAQVGISTDVEVTPGMRVPSGEEPALYQHLACELPHHRCIPGGLSTILEFDQTAAENPEAVLDILKGALKAGMRNLSVGTANSEFIRVTGYLVRRADLENARVEKQLRHSSASLGAGFFETKPSHLHRRERKV